jgi:uncharacterized repeat protein (TIGR03803 family)
MKPSVTLVSIGRSKVGAVVFPVIACFLATPPAAAQTLTTIASFNGTNGVDPTTGVTIDASGNLYGTTRLGGANNDGTVFEIARGSNTITTVASFNGTNGTLPFGGVTFDAAGNIFGASQQGGVNGFGTIFEIANGSNTISTLASFNGTTGSNPISHLTIDAAGNLYGTALTGGSNNVGTVFELVKGSNTISSLASFTGANGQNPGTSITFDAAGNLYGVTPSGGANGFGTVFEIANGSNTITTLASFNGANGKFPSPGLIIDAAGNMYGIAETGGANNDGTVFEILRGSNTITTLATFNGINGINPEAGLTRDAAGNLFGTTNSGGANNDGTVFEIASGSSSITTLVSFSSTTGFGIDSGVTLDAAGNLYGVTSQGGANGDGTVFEVTTGAVPEPSSIILLGLGGAAFAC